MEAIQGRKLDARIAELKDRMRKGDKSEDTKIQLMRALADKYKVEDDPGQALAYRFQYVMGKRQRNIEQRVDHYFKQWKASR